MHAVLDQLGTSPLPHHQALEVLTAKALGARDYPTAFKLADRRCRIEPPPLAHCYVLRADASHNLGDPAAAIADLFEALRISPDDLAALRRLFAWGSSEQRLSAAMGLVSAETDLRLLRDAMKLLFVHGHRQHVHLSIFDQTIGGWVAWDVGEEVELSIASGDHLATSILPADPFHALATDDIKAVSFSLARPMSSAAQTISLALGSGPFFSKRVAPNLPVTGAPRPVVSENGEAQPTIIIPVYEDFKATKACLDSLLADPDCGRDFRIVLIDDASPDEAIAQYLQTLSRLPFVELIVNDVNLGFIGSINRALASILRGDVLLLNADTVVPPGVVGRLRQAAHSASHIGTVVPLSNNSNISDFPVPYHANPLGSYEDVVELDRLAQQANQNLVVDIPNGTGFCLYMTRACIAAVGHLAETFERGYLEDIDFCLRAREQGFRNVCAPNIYVGHAGSRSFGDAKRALVVKNLAVLDYRFPGFREETSSFAKTDPLRAARINIERLRAAPAAIEPDEMASEMPSHATLKIEQKRADPGNVLAVIPTRPSTSEFLLLRELATALHESKPLLDIFVAGTTFDDERLMSHPNVFVSGLIESRELHRVLSTAHAGSILLLDFNGRDAVHPAFALADAMGLPRAYIDGAPGSAPVRPCDLAIPAGLPRSSMIERICTWLKGA